ncbi:hypothetical protein A7X67_14095 [Clostridium sp. W14A]|nr:hypothetical protein A7X67_14095 [Clostridium sp. W14A]
MKSKWKNLSSALSVFVAVLLAVILTVVIFIMTVFTNRAFEKSYRQDCAVALNGLSETIKDFDSDVQSAGNDLSENSDLIRAVKEKNNYGMASALKSDVLSYGLSYAFLTDKNGKIIASSDNELELNDLSGLQHIKQALKNQKALVNEVLTGKMLCVCYGAPIEEDKTVIGCVSAVCSLQSVSDSTVETNFLDRLKSTTGCEFSVFLGNEQINTTASKDKIRQNGLKMEQDVQEKVIQQKQNYLSKENISGCSYISGYMPIIGYNGSAVGALFTGKNISGIEQTQNTMILFAILVGVAFMLTAILILRRFIKKRVKTPLEQVVSLANHMEHGEIGLTDQSVVALTVHSRDEVGQVVSALENTVSGLQAYIGEISDILSAVSGGDLTVRTEKEYLGDFIEIKRALNTICQSLNHVFHDINAAAESIESRSRQIADSASSLSQGAAEQAGTTELLSDTIEKISTQIKKTADNAALASSISKKSFEEVEAGNRDVNGLLAAMNDINGSSEQIRKIIKTIDEIAFQTNILALNAAVESARAGEAGKGFAVVADEVRNLAVKSSQAAKQSSLLIENSISLVNKGMQAVDSTATAFRKFQKSTDESTRLIDEISKSTGEESNAVSEVTSGIAQIAEVVQKNSAASEENAAASHDLSLQSQKLHELTKKFKLQEGKNNPGTNLPAWEAVPEPKPSLETHSFTPVKAAE